MISKSLRFEDAHFIDFAYTTNVRRPVYNHNPAILRTLISYFALSYITYLIAIPIIRTPRVDCAYFSWALVLFLLHCCSISHHLTQSNKQ